MQASKRLEVGWGLGCGAWGLGFKDIYIYIGFRAYQGLELKDYKLGF